MTESCKTCRYWDSNYWSTEGSREKCLRNAPVATGILALNTHQEPTKPIWPVTAWDDRCGEYKAKEQEDE